MHKILLSTCLFFAFSIYSVQGQTESGRVLLGISSALGTGGNSSGLSITNFKSKSDSFEFDSERNFSYSLSPRIGFFVADNFVIGAETYYAYSKSKDVIIQGDIILGGVNGSSIGIGPFARYYIKTNTIHPIFEAGLSIGRTTVKSAGFSQDIIENLFRYGFGAGAAIPLGKKVSLDFLFAYTYSESKERDNNPDNLRAIVNDISLNIGFSIYSKTKNF